MTMTTTDRRYRCPVCGDLSGEEVALMLPDPALCPLCDGGVWEVREAGPCAGLFDAVTRFVAVGGVRERDVWAVVLDAVRRLRDWTVDEDLDLIQLIRPLRVMTRTWTPALDFEANEDAVRLRCERYEAVEAAIIALALPVEEADHA